MRMSNPLECLRPRYLSCSVPYASPYWTSALVVLTICHSMLMYQVPDVLSVGSIYKTCVFSTVGAGKVSQVGCGAEWNLLLKIQRLVVNNSWEAEHDIILCCCALSVFRCMGDCGWGWVHGNPYPASQRYKHMSHPFPCSVLCFKRTGCVSVWLSITFYFHFKVWRISFSTPAISLVCWFKSRYYFYTQTAMARRHHRSLQDSNWGHLNTFWDTLFWTLLSTLDTIWNNRAFILSSSTIDA